MKLLNEFKEFAVKGNVVDMGVGIVIGAAFTSVVNSLVKDVFTPLLGLALAGIDFTNWFITLKLGKSGGPYSTLAQAQADSAVTLNFGQFLNSIISFLIVAFVLFFLIRTINRLKQPQRRCFCLFYIQEKSYKEIVQITGYPYQKVRSAIQNARRNFRRLYGKVDFEF